jgi:hypothetical protein
MRSPGARFVITEGALHALRQRLFDPDADAAFLESHLISPPVHRLFVEKHFEEAVRKREEELNEAERRDFEDLLRRHDPLHATASREKSARTTSPRQLKATWRVRLPKGKVFK